MTESIPDVVGANPVFDVGSPWKQAVITSVVAIFAAVPPTVEIVAAVHAPEDMLDAAIVAVPYAMV